MNTTNPEATAPAVVGGLNPATALRLAGLAFVAALSLVASGCVLMSPPGSEAVEGQVLRDDSGAVFQLVNGLFGWTLKAPDPVADGLVRSVLAEYGITGDAVPANDPRVDEILARLENVLTRLELVEGYLAAPDPEKVRSINIPAPSATDKPAPKAAQ